MSPKKSEGSLQPTAQKAAQRGQRAANPQPEPASVRGGGAPSRSRASSTPQGGADGWAASGAASPAVAIAAGEAKIQIPAAEQHARIAELAYELYERRGRENGHDLEDWLEAERRIRGGAAPLAENL